jgi:hypothetical protein
LSGSVPLIAIQLDALRVEDHLLLNFVHVLDQTALRVDDPEEDSGGGEVDRAYWNQKAGPELMKVCDELLAMINNSASSPQELNYMRRYMGLRSNGVVRNFMSLAPKPTKRFTHVSFSNSNSDKWKEKFEEAGVPVTSKRKGRFRISVTPDEFNEHKDLICQAVTETVKEFEA